MPVDVVGIDHIYFSVMDMALSETFYDRLMIEVLGYRKNPSVIAGDPHVHYYNRHFGLSLRPAKTDQAHDSYASGLHHFCLRVGSVDDVDQVARELTARDLTVTEPAFYPQYAADYYAIFLKDPDGIRLEVTNFRADRKARMNNWDAE